MILCPREDHIQEGALNLPGIVVTDRRLDRVDKVCLQQENSCRDKGGPPLQTEVEDSPKVGWHMARRPEGVDTAEQLCRQEPHGDHHSPSTGAEAWLASLSRMAESTIHLTQS